MAWYRDNMRKTYVATYRDEKSMRAEVEAAASYGFMSQAMARAGSQWTVTYHRDERAWARIQVENALAQLRQEQGKLAQAKAKVSTLRDDLRSRFQAARAETSNPTQLEQRLMKSIADLIAARQAANVQRRVVIASYNSLRSAREEAARQQVDVPQGNLDVDAESAPIIKEIEEETPLLQREQALQQAQQAVLPAVQQWRKVVGDRWGVHGKAADAERKAQAVTNSRESGQLSTGNAADAKALKAEAARAQHYAKLQEMETLLQEREAALLRELEARDRRMAEVVG